PGVLLDRRQALAQRFPRPFPPRRSSDLCDASRRAAPPMHGARPDCVDQVRFKRTGTGRLGFPVMVTTKFKTGGEGDDAEAAAMRSEEHTSELQSRGHLVCRLRLEKRKRA